ncbi:MAG TPA: hypothetical protein VK464_11880, partial [Symbiobacteriaceae bacterium]|nr:hypothetical protein [Symbiobacteriaceae bacterium]
MRRMQCLTQLYTPLGLLHDGDGDGLPDGLNVRFSVGFTPGAIDVAARLGLESAGFTPGFTRPDAVGVPVYFGPSNAESPEPPVAVAEEDGLVALLDDGGLLVWGWEAARWLAATYPYTGEGEALLADLAPGRPIRSVTIRNGAVAAWTTGDGCVEAVPDKLTVTGAPERPAFTAPAVGDLPPAG